MVDLVELAPQLALPLARLLQQMPPRDGCVVRARKPWTFDRSPHPLVHASDQPVGNRDAGEYRQVALGHAEGHVGAKGVAPLGHHVTALENDAGRAPAWQNGTHDLAPRSRLLPLDAADVAAIRVVEAAGPRAVVRLGQGDG